MRIGENEGDSYSIHLIYAFGRFGILIRSYFLESKFTLPNFHPCNDDSI